LQAADNRVEYLNARKSMLFPALLSTAAKIASGTEFVPYPAYVEKGPFTRQDICQGDLSWLCP
jgi:hypothetical protein